MFALFIFVQKQNIINYFTKLDCAFHKVSISMSGCYEHEVEADNESATSCLEVLNK